MDATNNQLKCGINDRLAHVSKYAAFIDHAQILLAAAFLVVLWKMSRKRKILTLKERVSKVVSLMTNLKYKKHELYEHKSAT